jgi:hypothetical protein
MNCDNERLLITEETASSALREAGLDLSPAQLRVEQREDRWLVSLPGERLAWFAANTRGRERLNLERRILRLLSERCSFRVPRILFDSSQDGTCVPPCLVFVIHGVFIGVL